MTSYAKLRLNLLTQGICVLILASCASVSHTEREPASIPGASVSCRDAIAKLFPSERTKIDAKVAQIFSTKNPGWFQKSFNDLKAVIRRKLQVMNNHRYPVIAIDDYPLAHGWAQNAFGKLSTDQITILKPVDLNKEVMDTVQFVKDYPTAMRTYESQALELELRVAAIDEYLKSAPTQQFGIKLSWPQVTTMAGQESQLSFGEKYFGNIEVLKIHRNELTHSKKALYSSMSDRALDHATAIKRLETYRHELNSAIVDNSGAALPQEYKDFVDAMDALYDNVAQMRLKEDLIPATKAASTLKTRQLMAELKSIVVLDKPQLDAIEGSKAVDRLKQIVDYVKTLPAEERAALGLDKVTDAVTVLGQTRLARVGMLVGGLTGGPLLSWGSVQAVIRFVKHDEIAKNTCAMKPVDNDQDYLECSKVYLEQKFGSAFLLADWDLRDLTAASGKIADPKIRLEMEDLQRRRNEFKRTQYTSQAVSNIAKDELSRRTFGSAEYLEELTHLDDATFKKNLLDRDPFKGYLAFKYGVVYSKPEVQGLVRLIVEAKSDDERTLYTHKLDVFPNAKDLSKELSDLIAKRAEVAKLDAQDAQIMQTLSAEATKVLERTRAGTETPAQ